ncbi:hypothetical protein PRUPE_7G045200 [Prunus persica]|uniref:Uncharacterized protein n=1 Tax=Prunus persica TaxID=3760 RepID=A0A251N6N8_PRUPE|nr:hypothetical protein PRUPE_7G045200 [Prunus persica]
MTRILFKQTTRDKTTGYQYHPPRKRQVNRLILNHVKSQQTHPQPCEEYASGFGISGMEEPVGTNLIPTQQINHQ